MENSSNNDGMSDYSQQFYLAKLMLLKYGALHSFHELQLSSYPIACCNISIDGTVEFDASSKTVTYNVLTKRVFFKSGNKTKERHRWSIAKFFEVPADLYEKEKSLAFDNLQGWTRILLWQDTKVVLYVDGIKYKESTFN